MDTGKMRCFLTVVEHMSFSRAAEALYISQSAVSKKIASLEAEIGAPLFIRGSKELSLTPAGKAALKYIETILKISDEMEEELSSMPDSNFSEVVVRSDPFSNRAGFYEIMYGLEMVCPRLKIRKERLSSDAYSDICKGKYALVVAYWAGKPPQSVLSHVLKKDRLAVVVRADNPLSDREKVSLRDLSAESWVFPDKYTTLFDYCSELFRDAGFWPKIAFTEHMLMTGIAPRIIENGCVALIPETVAENIGSPHIRTVRLNAEYPVDMMFFYKPGKNRNFSRVIRYMTGEEVSRLENGGVLNGPQATRKL